MNLPKTYETRIKQILPKTEWETFFKNVTKPLPKTIRLTKDFKKIPKDWTLTPTAIPNTFFIKRENQKTHPLGKTLEHLTGKFYIASLSSLLPPYVLNPTKDDRTLDICAAPGSKTTLIAELMQNQSVLIANDPSSSRSKKLAANIKRMGCTNTIILQKDGTKLDQIFTQQFDKILLDAPCSSEGFSRKDSKFFQTTWNERTITQSAKLQRQLIIAAFNVLAPGGEMVYSTCTSAPEENEEIIQFLYNKFPDSIEILPITEELNQRSQTFAKIPTRPALAQFNDKKFNPQITKNVIRIWPHLENETWSSETFFIAKIKKTNPLKIKQPTKPHQKHDHIKIYKKNQTAQILTYINKKFGIEKAHLKPYTFIEKKDKSIYLTSKAAANFAQKNQHQAAGLKVLDQNKNITTTFALKFGNLATKNTIQLTEAQKEKWLTAADISLTTPLPTQNSEEVLAQFQNHCLGPGKITKEGKLLKNKLERNLI